MKQSMHQGYFRLSTAGDASTDMLIANSRSAFGTTRPPVPAATSYRRILGLAFLGLVVVGVIAVAIATDPVVLAWANPI